MIFASDRVENIVGKEENAGYQHFLLFQQRFQPITTQCRILTHLRCIAVENIVRKGEIACNKQFLLFSQCFLPYVALIFHFEYTSKCRLQFVSIWTSLKFCCLLMN